jgi:hypothetical protein
MEIDPEGRHGILEQYQSILDAQPNLVEYKTALARILLCAPVRQEPDVFQYYLEALRALEVPAGFEVDKLFIFHNCEQLKQHLVDGENCFVHNTPDEYVCDDTTHQWKDANFAQIIIMKNALLRYALDRGYNYIFLVDSDLVLQPPTLEALIAADKDIVAEVFWTVWVKGESMALPNAWHWDQYEIDGEELVKWQHEPGLYRVGMTGACTLIKRRVLEAGVSFNPLYNVSFTRWEDRAFCIRAAVSGFEIFLDTHYPAAHLYRREDAEKYGRDREIKPIGPSETKPAGPKETKKKKERKIGR